MSAQLQNRIREFILNENVTEGEFNDLAIEIFHHQFTQNAPFQGFCRSLGVTPRKIKTWMDIPALSINAFKELTLTCIPKDECPRIFMTSGTTRGDAKGRNYHVGLDIYDLSMKRFFEPSFMKNLGPRPLMATLFPSENHLPHSSLAHYLDLAKFEFGSSQSQCLFDGGVLDLRKSIEFLEKACQNDQPIALLGATFSFVHLMDALEQMGQAEHFQLPRGSKILDTGGFKGQSREIPMSVFYENTKRCFGVEYENSINMYGMTELSSQFYDGGQHKTPLMKRAPHWMKSKTIDPLSGQTLALGETGLLVHCDLANFNSVMCILTEDLGIMNQDGFQLLGRMTGAQPKGCSISVDHPAVSMKSAI
jgi:hypothetical protein